MPGTVTAVPSSPEEFIRLYRDYVAGLVGKLGVPSQEVEDVTADVLLAELRARNHAGEEVGILALYDPAHTADHQGERKPVTFRAFLSARVALRVRGKRETLQRRASRELLICDSPADGGTSWLDLFGGSVCDDYSHLEAEEFLAAVRDKLARVPRTSARDACDLIALFDELVSQVRSQGYIDRLALQDRFSVGDTTVTAWVGRLRRIMAAAGDLPAPESHVIGGVSLTLAEIRQAINILRSARGIMVRQPLAAAGHPLAAAQKGWYHLFAREEIRAFPEIEVDPQTHRKPAGHVKIAVLHRLERMLGLAMAETPAPPEPEPEPAPEDLMEAKLWAAGIRDAGVVDEVKAMYAELEAYRRQGVAAA